MASPHVIMLAKVGFNSIVRTAKNVQLQVAQSAIYDDTAQYPLNERLSPQAGAKFSTLSFTTELNPSGSAAGAKTPPDGVLFKACGLDEAVVGTTSTTYTVNGDLPTEETPLNIDTSVGNGYKQTCGSAVGNVVLNMIPGQPIMCNWLFNGTYTAPSETAISDTVTNGGLAPVCINGTITLNSDTLVMKSFSINLNNVSNAPNLDMAATNGTQAPHLVNQAPTFETVVELPALSTANYWTDLTNHTITPFSFAIGSGAGYVITITGKGYLMSAQQLQNLSGMLGARLVYRMDWASGSPIAIAFT